MRKIKNKTSKGLCLSLLLLLLVAHQAWAEETNSIWENYKKAAQLFNQDGSGDEIAALCKGAIENTEDPALFCRASFLLADTYIKQLQFTSAEKVLKEIEKSKFEIPQALLDETNLRQGQLLIKLRQPERAVLEFRKVADQDLPGNLREQARIALAWENANRGSWAETDSLIQIVIEANPLLEQDVRIITLRARKALAEKDAQAAIQLLRTSRDLLGLQFLAQAYEMINNKMMAVSIYKRIYDLFPKSPEAEDALFQAAEVFMRAGDWLAARSEFSRLMEYFPNGKYDASIRFRLGWIYLNLAQLDKALNEFRFNPPGEHFCYFRYMEAECLRRMGAGDPDKLQQAIQLFHNIASMNLNSPVAPLAKIKAALTEIEKGDSTSAMISLKQFLSIFPKDELKPAVNFLIAVNENPAAQERYLNDILQSGINDEIFNAAIFVLQETDYQKKNYQEVINRNAMVNQTENQTLENYWQRANHLLLAESAYYLKHYERAFNEYDLVRSENLDELTEKAELGKAWCIMQTGHIDSAIQAFATVHNKVIGMNQTRAAYGYATGYYRLQNYEEAIKAYPMQQDSIINPEFIPLYANSLYRSAECLYRLQYYAQAIEYWQRLVSEYPNSEHAPKAMFQVAETYFRANHFEDADSAYQIIVRMYTGSQFATESSLRLAQTAYNAGEYELAIERYQGFLRDYPNHEKNKDALEGIQLCYYQMGQSEKASEALAKVVEMADNSDLAADARFRIASGYLQEGQYDQAVEAYKEIVTLYPNSSYAMDSQFALSKSFIAQEDYEAASRELNRFIHYFPGSNQIAEAYYMLGVVYYNNNSYLSAVDYFQKLERDFPDTEFFANAMQNIGLCYDKLNEKELAIEYFNKYLAAKPEAENKFAIYLQMAQILKDANQTENAIEILEELKANKDQDVAVEAAYQLGEIYLSQNSADKAIAEFKQAIKKGAPDNYYRLSAISQLASIYENAGKQQEAISSYKLIMSSTSDERWKTAAEARIADLSQ